MNLIVAIEYGFEHHQLIGVFSTIEMAKQLINIKQPDIEWEHLPALLVGIITDPAPVVLLGGKRVKDAVGDGTHLDHQIKLYAVQTDYHYWIDYGKSSE